MLLLMLGCVIMINLDKNDRFKTIMDIIVFAIACIFMVWLCFFVPSCKNFGVFAKDDLDNARIFKIDSVVLGKCYRCPYCHVVSDFSHGYSIHNKTGILNNKFYLTFRCGVCGSIICVINDLQGE